MTFSYSIIEGLLASTVIVISAVYSIYVYNRVCVGLFSKYIYFSRDLNRREFFGDRCHKGEDYISRRTP